MTAGSPTVSGLRPSERLRVYLSGWPEEAGGVLEINRAGCADILAEITALENVKVDELVTNAQASAQDALDMATRLNSESEVRLRRAMVTLRVSLIFTLLASAMLGAAIEVALS